MLIILVLNISFIVPTEFTVHEGVCINNDCTYILYAITIIIIPHISSFRMLIDFYRYRSFHPAPVFFRSFLFYKNRQEIFRNFILC